MPTITETTTIEVNPCAACGMLFGITADFEKRRREDHKIFYCPSGHENYYGHESEAEKLRRELAAAEGRLANARAAEQSARRRIESEKRSHAATKGQLTKTKKRIVNGVCPCCPRSFTETGLVRHIRSQHPEYVKETLP